MADRDGNAADMPSLMGNLQLTDNDMVVDDYDQYGNDRSDVVVVSPPGSASEPEPEPLATDFIGIPVSVLWFLIDCDAPPDIALTSGPPPPIIHRPLPAAGYALSTIIDYMMWCVEAMMAKVLPENPDLETEAQTYHTWNIENWTKLRRKEHGPVFECGGAPWWVFLILPGPSPLCNRSQSESLPSNPEIYRRVLFFPFGNGVEHASFYLEHGFEKSPPDGWYACVQFALVLWNKNDPSLYITHVTIRRKKLGWSNSAWTLQRLFYHLQTSDLPVSTAELTSSFGWESRHTFEQQDVQELSRLLMDKLEGQMKGTPAEKALPSLFVGKTKTYISCIHVDYESSRIEDFWDIQLNVRGNRTLDDSFKDYIQVETLEGENKYDAGEPYKLQEAKKGVIFESFPPVLHLHLKRFEYDINRDAMMKINDRLEFPEEFDAAPYLSEDADKSEPWIYQLHGVLVHSGDFNAGHYYAYLRPTKDSLFYRFDDDKVIRATMKETLEENFGGEYPNLANGTAGVRQPYMRGFSTKRSMNAYMLVYIRKSRVDDVLVSLKKDDIPAHLEKRLNEERAELARKKKEREEQHLYMNIGLLTDESFKSHHGFDLTSLDLEPDNPAAAKIHRVLRAKKVGEFAADIAEEKGLTPDQVRLWVMVNRQNKTTRPDQPLKDLEMSVEEAFTRFGTKGNQFRLFVEVGEIGTDGKVTWPETSGNNATSLVFLKHFDVLQQTLTGVGHAFVRKHSKVSELAGPILEIMNWPAGTPFILYEEIKHSMIEPMKSKQTFQQSEIQDGDIICFQRQVNDSELPPTVLYTDARQYYDYLLNRISVKFAPLKPDDSETFDLTLSRKMTYEQWTTKVGEHLNVDPTHIRFAPVLQNSGKPKPFIKRNATQNLQQILTSQYSAYGYAAHRPDALYYEILETSLSEYETKKIIKVTWLPDGISKEDLLLQQPFDVLVSKSGNIGDLLLSFRKRANLDEETSKNLRCYEVYGGKVYKEIPENYSILSLSDYVTLYIERIPQEELDMQEGEFKIDCFNFDKEPNKPHGVPFRFVVKPGEIFKETKERLSKRTGIRGKQFEKIKFAMALRQGFCTPRYIEDDDVLADLATEPQDVLGLDHVNKNRSFWRSESFFIR
ncbi:ubiquitin carboxyl-terminal hydrolase [Histoplasma capsulatum var. duboisii H88]|uniref:ubiquitinyl hydrolase 1 n=2 Tax=Ajellomyces capsulatus TaxID=5037 RepID=F0UPR4_AJEC8|nr:ubiquitin carboxyl-terminal hydrolase [Histoplasma capsulatum H143]EGC47017.1 ubiquitin carboxyl-terminal hydrolase [Histoplasma capsulatum var. duboisii H88]